MVDARALKVAALLVGAAVLLFVVSFALRIVSRIITWSILVLIALAAGYVTYQLYKGWSAAGEDADAEVETGDASATDSSDVETVQEQYTSGELSDEAFEAELEDVVDAGADAEPAPESESEQ